LQGGFAAISWGRVEEGEQAHIFMIKCYNISRAFSGSGSCKFSNSSVAVSDASILSKQGSMEFLSGSQVLSMSVLLGTQTEIIDFISDSGISSGSDNSKSTIQLPKIILKNCAIKPSPSSFVTMIFSIFRTVPSQSKIYFSSIRRFNFLNGPSARPNPNELNG
jgi:hypothetical protein